MLLRISPLFGKNPILGTLFGSKNKKMNKNRARAERKQKPKNRATNAKPTSSFVYSHDCNTAELQEWIRRNTRKWKRTENGYRISIRIDFLINGEVIKDRGFLYFSQNALKFCFSVSKEGSYFKVKNITIPKGTVINRYNNIIKFEREV